MKMELKRGVHMSRISGEVLAWVATGIMVVAGVQGTSLAGQTLWSQPIGIDDMGRIIGTARVSCSAIPWLMADDFICNVQMEVHGLRWWGGYVEALSGTGPTNYCVPFTLRMYESSPGPAPNLPGTLFLTTTLLAIEVLVGTNQVGVPIFEYTALFTVPWFPASGQRYFLSLERVGCEDWGWQESCGVHPTAGCAVLSIFGDQGPWVEFRPKTDLAFELLVPEPKPSLIVITAIGLLLVFVWRLSPR